MVTTYSWPCSGCTTSSRWRYSIWSARWCSLRWSCSSGRYSRHTVPRSWSSNHWFRWVHHSLCRQNDAGAGHSTVHLGMLSLASGLFSHGLASSYFEGCNSLTSIVFGLGFLSQRPSASVILVSSKPLAWISKRYQGSGHWKASLWSFCLQDWWFIDLQCLDISSRFHSLSGLAWLLFNLWFSLISIVSKLKTTYSVVTSKAKPMDMSSKNRGPQGRISGVSMSR